MGAGCDRLRFADIGEDAPAILEIATASLGQLDGARGAGEETCADHLFQRRHRPRYDRRAHVQLTGGIGETAGFGHLDEDPHRLAAVHAHSPFAPTAWSGTINPVTNPSIIPDQGIVS